MESWDISDSEQLIKLYVDDKLELLEICRIMKRKCKVIISKLIELKIVKSKYDIRGNNTINYTKSNNIDYKAIDQTQSIAKTQNQTIVLLENVNKIITQASIVCSNYSKLVSSVKNIYNSDK